MGLKYAPTVVVDFAERRGVHASPFKAKRETPDAGKQVEH
jgi:hypothetical protein